jgi:hypothetical protein
MTRLHTNTVPIEFTVWLWGLSVGLLLGVNLGLLRYLPGVTGVRS